MITNNALIQQHQQAGRFIQIDGIQTFVRESGAGAPIICLHGVPSSSFLYRKVLKELALKQFNGIAFDFPGLGLSDRPNSFDYSWTGLGKWAMKAVDA